MGSVKYADTLVTYEDQFCHGYIANPAANRALTSGNNSTQHRHESLILLRNIQTAISYSKLAHCQ